MGSPDFLLSASALLLLSVTQSGPSNWRADDQPKDDRARSFFFFLFITPPAITSDRHAAAPMVVCPAPLKWMAVRGPGAAPAHAQSQEAASWSDEYAHTCSLSTADSQSVVNPMPSMQAEKVADES